MSEMRRATVYRLCGENSIWAKPGLLSVEAEIGERWVFLADNYGEDPEFKERYGVGGPWRESKEDAVRHGLEHYRRKVAVQLKSYRKAIAKLEAAKEVAMEKGFEHVVDEVCSSPIE